MHWLVKTFSNWTSKDWFLFGTSILALFASLVSVFQKSADSKAVLRKQLSDALKEINELNTKDATFRSSANKENYPENYVALLNDQRRYLVHVAGWLAGRLKKLMGPFEKVVIGGTFGNLQYPDEAERFFQSAEKTSKTPIDKNLTLRNYGRFLYRQGRREEAMDKYSGALEAIPGATDQALFYRGDTLVRLAEDQSEMTDDSQVVTETLNRASELFSLIKNRNLRQTEMARVAKKHKSPYLNFKVGQGDTDEKY